MKVSEERDLKHKRYEYVAGLFNGSLTSLLDAKVKLEQLKKCYKSDIQTWQLHELEQLTIVIKDLIAVGTKINNVGKNIVVDFLDESDSQTLEDMLR